MKHFNDGRDWFFEKRFGFMMHWGLYSIPAWHEQHQWRGRVPREEYVKLAAQWNPVHYDPEAWLDLAQEVGMSYVVITTKHHDGFCLWDTKQTDFNTMNTPYGRDVIGMLAEACHRRGVPLGLYYSCVDWHQKNYPNQGRHHELDGPGPNDEPDHAQYMEFLKAQVRELCTNYGEIASFWWDMNVEEHIDRSVNAMIRELQPSAVICDRGYDEGDYGTPERDFEKNNGERAPFERMTEATQAIGTESWGYRQNEHYYTDRHLEASIDKYLARGANYLLNVGPMADGRIEQGEAAFLRRIGAWYGAVRESLEQVEWASDLVPNPVVLLTRRGNTLYVHLNQAPISDAVKLMPLATLPRRATLLNNGQPVECAVDLLPSEHMALRPCLCLRRLPVNELANTVLVVQLEFDELPQTLEWAPLADGAVDICVR